MESTSREAKSHRNNFCPLCGDLLASKLLGYDHYPYLVCERGDMKFDRVLQGHFQNRFNDIDQPLPEGWKAPAWNKDETYCFGCGDALDGEFKCGRCRKAQRDLLGPVIIRYRHREDF